MAKDVKIIFLILIFCLKQFGAMQCHYSCYSCAGELYTECINCFNNQSASLAVTVEANKSYGTCAQTLGPNPNILGIFLCIITLIACVLVANQKIYYFALIIQNLGLLFFMDIYWTLPFDYFIESFSSMMIFSYLSSSLKPHEMNLSQKSRYKSVLFLKNADLKSNLIVLGPFTFFLMAMLVIIPIYKVCRKIKIKERNLWLPDSKLDKLVIVVNTLFLFQIQQLSLIVMICFGEGLHHDVWDYLILAFYLIIMVVFFLNVCFLQLPYFRNKTSQSLIIFSKIIGPIFILGDEKTQFVFYIYMLILIFWQLIITNKNPDAGQANRLFFYKFAVLIAFLSTLLYYILEIKVKKEKISRIFGIINAVFFGIVLYLFLLQICLSLKELYCLQVQIVDPTQITQQTFDMSLNDMKVSGKIHPAIDNMPALLNSNVSNENLTFIIKSSRNVENQFLYSNQNQQIANMSARRKGRLEKNQKQMQREGLKMLHQENQIVNKHIIQNKDLEFFIPSLPNYNEDECQQQQQGQQITIRNIQQEKEVSR